MNCILIILFALADIGFSVEYSIVFEDECETGYHFINGACHLKCENCEECNFFGECIICKPGYQWNIDYSCGPYTTTEEIAIFSTQEDESKISNYISTSSRCSNGCLEGTCKDGARQCQCEEGMIYINDTLCQNSTSSSSTQDSLSGENFDCPDCLKTNHAQRDNNVFWIVFLLGSLVLHIIIAAVVIFVQRYVQTFRYRINEDEKDNHMVTIKIQEA